MHVSATCSGRGEAGGGSAAVLGNKMGRKINTLNGKTDFLRSIFFYFEKVTENSRIIVFF